MNIRKVTLSLEQETGIELIKMTEMPIPDQPALKHLRHLIIVNVGPVSVDLSNPETALDTCLLIFDKIISALGGLKDCASSRFSISIFVPPGDQSSRILAGYVETGKSPLRPGEKLCVHEARSNLKSIDQVISSRKLPQ